MTTQSVAAHVAGVRARHVWCRACLALEWGLALAKLCQHKADGTYYTRIYVGGIVTRQIHPDGVAYLKNEGVRLDGEIPTHAMSTLMSRDWLFTKEEMHKWGEVDWAPVWHSIGVPAANPFKETVRRMAAEKKRRQLEEEAAAQRRLTEELKRGQQPPARPRPVAERQANPARTAVAAKPAAKPSTLKKAPTRKLAPPARTWLSGEGPVKSPLAKSGEVEQLPPPLPSIAPVPASLATLASPPISGTTDTQEPAVVTHQAPHEGEAALMDNAAPQASAGRGVYATELLTLDVSVPTRGAAGDRTAQVRKWLLIALVASLLLVCLVANVIDMTRT